MLDVPGDALILQEEVFGPVAAVVPVDSVDEAIAVANDSDLGFKPPVYLEPGDGDARGRGAAGRIGLDQRADALLSGHVSLRGLRHERDRA